MLYVDELEVSKDSHTAKLCSIVYIDELEVSKDSYTAKLCSM